MLSERRTAIACASLAAGLAWALSSCLAPVAPTTENTVVAPGQTIDLQTAYSDPRCDATATGRAAFLLNLRGAAALAVRLDRRGQALLDRLYARECALAQIADVASVRFGPSFSRVRVNGEPYLRLSRTRSLEQVG